MKYETYKKYREEFFNNYDRETKNELGYVPLENIKVHNFQKFLILFSFDILSCSYDNITQSVSKYKQYVIRNNRPVVLIRIDDRNSMFDKYDIFDNALDYFNKQKENI